MANLHRPISAGRLRLSSQNRENGCKWRGRRRANDWSRHDAQIRRDILGQAERSSFPPLVGATAFLSTLTMSVPVEWLVVVAALACRRQWTMTALMAAVGSATASLGLYLTFHHFGWSILLARYPELADSQAWSQATDWLSKYGLLAIFALMALPLPVPKVPMLAVAGIYRLPITDVFVAILAGKIIKYLAYSYLAVRFPEALRFLTQRGSPADRVPYRVRSLMVARMTTSRKIRTFVTPAGGAETHHQE
ncbi:VTT domain-containing protein [Bradyrhizobium sp. CCH5-F6]|jgi:membrane protein YqaA with SNARE-associated domain|uniref:YqaA family protein n=1 Tax=Bradyrhizobium sp. CCH5-F6 TaxID=1768753 RepID=UPI00179C8CFA|nr:VTT domain-containing protein [Bradyrhizobium sp. CCH5-F6]